MGETALGSSGPLWLPPTGLRALAYAIGGVTAQGAVSPSSAERSLPVLGTLRAAPAPRRQGHSSTPHVPFSRDFLYLCMKDPN